MKKITDEFSELPISRQRKYQLRKESKGLCRICGQKAVNKSHCEKHNDMAKGYMKKIRDHPPEIAPLQ